MAESRFRARFVRNTAALVLAGGRGRRLGGRDKGLVRWRGLPMAVLAARAIGPPGVPLIISANRHLSRYRQLADRVVTDRVAGYQGPLAGIAAALSASRARVLLVCPCDVVALPADLPVRLLRALRVNGPADAAVVRDAERCQHLVAALRARVQPNLEAYLASGGRSVHGWLDGLRVVEVPIAGRLANHNVPQQATSAQQD